MARGDPRETRDPGLDPCARPKSEEQLHRRDSLSSELYSSCALRVERSQPTPLYPHGRAISTPRYARKKEFSTARSTNLLMRPGKFLFETSLAEHSNRDNGAPSTKERDERNCPDGVTEQCRSDPHTHRHNEHNCGRNNGNKPVHGAP